MAAFRETVVHHCEVVSDKELDGGKSEWDTCGKREIHNQYLSVDNHEFKEHLPPEGRTEEVLKVIQNQIDRTVMIKVTSTSSENRSLKKTHSENSYPFCDGSEPVSVRFGTGYIQFINYLSGSHSVSNEHCPCRECKTSNQSKMEYWKFPVMTAAHVVYDDNEAKSAIIELFYDNENREGVQYLYGVGVSNTDVERYKTDKCLMTCVTHEKDLATRLESLCKSPNRSLTSFIRKFGIVVSHPHGVSKRMSIGKPLEVNVVCRKPDSSVTLHKGSLVKMVPSVENSKPDLPAFLIQTEVKDVFKLNVALKAFMPLGTIIKCQCDKRQDWYTFPTNTKFVSNDGTSLDNVPTGIEFYLNNYNLWDEYHCDRFLTYDMATCEGSSGAYVNAFKYVLEDFTHMGCEEGIPRSGFSR